MRNTERVYVDSVDAYFTQLVLVVEKNALDGARYVRQQCNRCQEPAVAYGPLADVMNTDAFLCEESRFWVLIFKAHPLDSS